jgi:RimJ/RimL family protein N-acetyltransferase
VIAQQSPHAVELIPSTMDMPALYEWSDRVISAGGSSSYEWMRMRVPGWVTAVAMNQEQFVAAMLERGFAAGVASIEGLSPEALAALLNQWLDDPTPPQLGQIDGWGALRVAAAMADVPCWIRPVEVASDAEFLLSLANEPSVRNVGCYPAKIEMEEHHAWLNRHHASPSSRLMVIETLEGGPVGQARFHEREPQVWEIGISILPAARMAGLAATALGLAMRAVSATTEVKTWLARIRKDNQASSRLFAKLGFVVRSDDGEMQNWELPNKINQPLKS